MVKYTELIAEIGQAHDGSLGILHSLIDAIGPTGVDTIKFQVHIADAESSEYEPFRVNFSKVDVSRQEYWRRMELTPAQWAQAKTHCEEYGVEFLASPFSCAAVDLLEDLGVRRYKIGSGELRNLVMLEKIAQTGKPTILSSGMSSYDQIQEAVDLFAASNSSVSVLQCTTQYPTSPESIGLNVITELKNRFGIPVGFSDHSGTIFSCLAAVALGAELLEFHVTFDKKMFGPDATSSLTIEEITELVHGARYIDTALNNPVDKSDTEKFSQVRLMFEKSLSVSRDIAAGEHISFEDLETAKPAGYGIPASDYRKVLGRQLRTNKRQYEFLTENDLL